MRVIILSCRQTWPPAPTQDTSQGSGPGPPRGTASPGSPRQLPGPPSNLLKLLILPTCRPNPLRPPGVLGVGGARPSEARNVFWDIPPDPRRISAPAFGSPVRVPCPRVGGGGDGRIARIAQVIPYTWTQTKRDTQAHARPTDAAVQTTPHPTSRTPVAPVRPAALSPPPDSPGPPPPSAAAAPFASPWGSRRRSTAPAAAAARAAGGRGAAAGRRRRGRGGAWRAAAPGRAEQEDQAEETRRRDVIRVWPRRVARPPQAASMPLSPARLPPCLPPAPLDTEFPSCNRREPPPQARHWAGPQPGPPPPARPPGPWQRSRLRSRGRGAGHRGAAVGGHRWRLPGGGGDGTA